MDIGKAIRAARKRKDLTLEKLALLVDTDSGNLSRLERGKQGASQELLTKILTVLDLTIGGSGRVITSGGDPQPNYSPSDSDYALVRQYLATGECGDGYHNEHVELSSGLAFKRDWLARIGSKPENLAVIYASGNSMEPFIFDGDVVLFDTSDIEPRHGQVYVVRRPDYSVSIKRLSQLLSGDWVISSDNELRKEEVVNSETIHKAPIIGRVIWRGGNIS